MYNLKPKLDTINKKIDFYVLLDLETVGLFSDTYVPRISELAFMVIDSDLKPLCTENYITTHKKNITSFYNYCKDLKGNVALVAHNGYNFDFLILKLWIGYYWDDYDFIERFTLIDTYLNLKKRKINKRSLSDWYTNVFNMDIPELRHHALIDVKMIFLLIENDPPVLQFKCSLYEKSEKTFHSSMSDVI